MPERSVRTRSSPRTPSGLTSLMAGTLKKPSGDDTRPTEMAKHAEGVGQEMSARTSEPGGMVAVAVHVSPLLVRRATNASYPTATHLVAVGQPMPKNAR